MKSKVLMVLIGLTLTLSMVLGILAGCGPAPTPTGTVAPTGTAKPTATATAKPTATAPKPTATAGQIVWRAQSSSSAGDLTWWIQQRYCDNITKASGGRLKVDIFPNGAIVSRNEQFDAVSTGAIEMAPQVSENDWGGKDQLFEINNIPAGMSQWVSIVWGNYKTEDDEKSPADKLLAATYAKFGIKAIFVGSKGPEVGAMSNKRITQPADYKGLTFRGAGWELEIIAEPEFGAKPVFIPSADLYSAIQTGVIDALESGNPAGNWRSGYQDITKYWTFPGMNNLNQTNYCLINQAAWDALPEDLKLIVELAAKETCIVSASYNLVESAKVMPLLVQKGIVLSYVSTDVQMLWRNMMLKSIEKRGQTYPAFKTEALKALDFMYMLDAYIDLQTPIYDAAYPGRKENLKGFSF